MKVDHFSFPNLIKSTEAAIVLTCFALKPQPAQKTTLHFPNPYFPNPYPNLRISEC